MASAQVVEKSVINNGPSQDSNHPDDLFQSRSIIILQKYRAEAPTPPPACIWTADILTLIVEEESVYNIRDCDECNDIYMLMSEFCYFRGTGTH